MKDYCSLHNHTTFSIMDSLIKSSEIFKKAKELGQSAIAITDHGTLAAAHDSLKYSREAGVKLLMGCEFYFVDDVSQENNKLRHIILIAKNAIGYKNLLHLSKEGFSHNIQMFKKVIPRIDWKLLESHSEGVICTTACGGGIISQLINTRKLDEAKIQTKRLKDIFGNNLGLEIQPHGMRRVANLYKDYEDQNFTNHQLIKLGKELDIKVVAATDAHYLTPDQHSAHDVLLAIGSGQPITSGNRLKYIPEFHVKSREEVYNFFANRYPDQADEFCDNSLYFSDLCEIPNWIDPKFSNSSGKELPEFPVKNQLDYQTFKNWQKDQSEKIQSLPDDAAYLRYWCDRDFNRLLPYVTDKRSEYLARLDEEYDVIEYHGFSSYMLIVADFINHCKTNNVSVGAGRGCLAGGTKVLTINGFKQLDQIIIGDQVYTHTGKVKPVIETFKYDVSKEELIEVRTENSFDPIIMTSDHKVFASKSVETDRYKSYRNNSRCLNNIKRWENLIPPSWIPISELKENDYIYTTTPQSTIKNIERIDLASYVQENIKIYDNYLEQTIPCDNKLSIRYLYKITGISRNCLKFIKKNGFKPISNGIKMTRHIKACEKLSKFLGYDVSVWAKNTNVEIYKLTRFLDLDEEFIYILGRWTGDGWWRNTKGIYNIGIAFHSSDESINRIENFFIKHGFKTYRCYHKTKKLIQLMVVGKLIYSLFKSLFKDYKSTSNTKHFPEFFRNLSPNLSRQLLLGLIHSDGHISERYNIDSTSIRLINEVKEVLLYLGIASSVHTRKSWLRGVYKCKQSYKIRFNKIAFNSIFIKSGYYSKITSLKPIKNDYVYDINIDEDHSYLTSNYVVHNSVGGSLIAYLLNIHIADPIKYGLIFARFHNKEKQAYPDIDSDFESAGKTFVQNYIRNKYGEENFAHVSNIMMMKPKGYAKDISRAFVYGGNQKAAVEVGIAISDTIPQEINDTCSLEKAIEQAPLFGEYADKEKYKELKLYAKDLNSLPKAWSTHAGGVVIGKRPLVEIVPLRRDKDNEVAIEYEKERVEANGLVKMDILGLSTLDIVKTTHKIIKETGKTPPPKQLDYDLNDKKTYDLISEGKTLCVFQLGESAATIDLCKKIQPKCIEDLAQINTLARPQAKELRQDFIDARNDGKKIELLHPSLEKAFLPTWGFPIYEECLMEVGRDVAGWNLNEADRLRKLTKDKGKNPEKIAKWRLEFIDDAVRNKNIDREMATRIWDEIIDKFQGYAFNHSHAILYSFLGYETAYLKAYFPLEFLTANLMSEVSSNAKKAKDNILQIKNEIRKMNVKIIPPDLNTSEMSYKIVNQNTLMTGLDSLKYIGKDAIPEILAKRPFISFEDFLSRTNSSKVKAPAIQALAASGSLDNFGMTRKAMYLYASDYKKKLQVWLKKKKKEEGATFNYPWPTEKDDWNIPQKYAMEMYYLGEGLSGNKFQVYAGFFNSTALKFNQLAAKFPDPGDSNEHGFLPPFQAEVKSFFEFKVKKEDSKSFGKPMAKVLLEDPWGTPMMMTVFPKQWPILKERIKLLTGGKIELQSGIAIYARGSLNWYEGDISIIFEDLLSCAPPPAMPPELKAQKISMRTTRNPKASDIQDKDADGVLEMIEDEMIEDGFSSEIELNDSDFEFEDV